MKNEEFSAFLHTLNAIKSIKLNKRVTILYIIVTWYIL